MKVEGNNERPDGTNGRAKASLLWLSGGSSVWQRAGHLPELRASHIAFRS